MLSRALALLSRLSSKLLHEVLPVALASVIGTILVNHYSRQNALPVVIQTQPPAAEHEIIADYLKRDADAKPAAATTVRPSVETAMEDRPAKAHVVSLEKSTPLSPARPPPVKSFLPRESRPAALEQLLPREVAAIELALYDAPSDGRPWFGPIQTVRNRVVNAARAPARMLAWRPSPYRARQPRCARSLSIGKSRWCQAG